MEAPLDIWLQDVAGGNLGAERAELLARDPNAEDSSIAAMVRASRNMVETIAYAEAKMNLGDGMVTTFNYYNDKLTELEGLANEVTRGEITKATALATIDEAITSNEITFASLQTYFAKEPGENAYNGTIMLLGDQFNDNLNEANILAAVEEARNRDIRSILRTNGNIEARPDIPLLELQYQDQVNLYGNIKNQRTEAEDNLRTVGRQTRILMRDVEIFKDEVCNAGSSDLSPSVLKDFLDQLADMKKRLTNIRSMDDHEPPVVPIDVTEYDSDGEETVSTLTIEEFFSKMRRKLLHLKDKTTESKRKKRK